MNKFLLFISIILCSVSTLKAQQEPLQTQYNFNLMSVNPAYVGVYDLFSVNFSIRKQWINFSGAPITYMAGAQTSLANNKVGTGFQVEHDRFGVNRNTDIKGFYSYKIPINLNTKLSFGLQAGLQNYTFNYGDLTMKSSDPSFDAQPQSITRPNFGTGILLLNQEKYYIGFSVPRITNTRIEDGLNSSFIYKRHYYLTGGYLIDVIPSLLKIRPSVLVRVVEGAPASIDLSAMGMFANGIWAGVSLRNLNSINVMGQLQIKESTRIGLSVDLLTNEITRRSLGTFEIIALHDFEWKDKHALGMKYF